MLKLANINVRRFRLSDQFIEQYKNKPVPWGPVGYITFKRTYMHSTTPFATNLTLVSRPYAGVSSSSNTSIFFSKTL